MTKQFKTTVPISQRDSEPRTSATAITMYGLGAALAVISAMPLMAHAAAASTNTQTAASNADGGLEEVVVTARRREERIDDVPISMAAIGSDQLAAFHITSTEDLGNFVPNVQFSPVAPSSGNSSSSAIFIRGVGQTDFIASTDPGVGFYVDGVYFARASGTVISLLDVDQVEVLRGPQGTLFGRNTIGGAIQVLTKKPNLTEFGGHVGVETGSYNRGDIDATLNVPFSETFGMRLAATHRQRDGYVTRIFDGLDLGDQDTDAARLSFLWKPNDQFELLLAGDYTRDNSHGAPTVFAGINTSASFVAFAAVDAGCPGATAPPAAPSVPENNDSRCPNNQWLALGPYKTAATGPVASRLEMFGGALTATWKPFDDVTIKSITAYRRTKPFSMRDADNTPQLILSTINQDDVKQFSQEFQFLGDAFDNRLHWQAGLYYFRESDYQFYPVYLPSKLNTAGLETQVGGLNTAADILNKSLAVFTQETFDITNKLNFTMGLRYTSDDKETTPYFTASPSIYGYTNVGYAVPNSTPGSTTCVGLATAPPSRPCTGSTDYMYAPVLNTKKNDKLTPMASLQYRWTPDLMTYVSYSEGYKSGGINTRIIQPVITSASPTGREFLPTFDPESVKSWEIGAKSTIASVLHLTAAAFHAKYDDIQIVVRQGVAPVVMNAGQATIDGLELEGNLALHNLEVSGGFGYTHFKYGSFTDSLNASQVGLADGALGKVDLSDLQAYSPEISATLGLSYRFDTGIGSFTPRVDGVYRSKTYFDAANTEQIAQDAYAVYNASIHFATANKKWSASAGVTNLNNKAYRVSGNSSLTASSGYAEVTYAPPRQWFLQGSVDF